MVKIVVLSMKRKVRIPRKLKKRIKIIRKDLILTSLCATAYKFTERDGEKLLGCLTGMEQTSNVGGGVYKWNLHKDRVIS